MVDDAEVERIHDDLQQEWYASRDTHIGDGVAWNEPAKWLIRSTLEAAAAAPPTQQEPHDRYREPFEELYGHLAWMQNNPNLKGHWGKNLGKIATDLIRDAYPDLGVPEVPTEGGKG